jgi:hypothetical protein
MPRLPPVFLFGVCYGAFGKIYLLLVPHRCVGVTPFCKKKVVGISSGVIFATGDGCGSMLDRVLSGS